MSTIFKRFKKTIALVLTAFMLVQALPVTTYASEGKDDGEEYGDEYGLFSSFDEEDMNYTPYPDAASVSNPNSGMTWDEYFGGVANTGFSMSKMPLVSLENGYYDYVAHGGYTSATPAYQRYIGTPFAWVQDNVHPGPGGKLNCTAFFTWLVLNMGVSQSTYMSKTSYGSGGLYSLRRVTDTFRALANNGRIIMYNFPSFEAAQASGKLKKGDIMIMEPANGNSHDHHFTVYWGDTPNQNIVQHSIDSSDCILYHGNEKSGNIISNLPVGSWGRRVWTFPNSVFEFYIGLQKESGTPDIADGSEFTIMNERQDEVLCVAVVDKNGNIKSIKNKINDDDFKLDLITYNGQKYIRVMEHEAGSRIYNDTTAMKVSVKQTSSPAGTVSGDSTGIIIVGNGLDKRKNISIKESIDYSAVFDFNFYINKYPDVKKAVGNNKAAALNHFITFGMKEGRQGSANFDVNSYKNRYSDLRIQFRNDLPKYYMHYINTGKKKGLVATGNVQLVPLTKWGGVDYSAVYDFNYYKTKYSDINRIYGKDDVGALEHFVNSGMKEGRQASAAFDVKSYKNKYSDLRTAYKNDLKQYYLHYIKFGKKENRVATGVTKVQNPITKLNGVDYSAVYDFNYYISRYSDIKRLFGNDDVGALDHFIKSGMKEGRQAKATFNVEAYKSNYADLNRNFKNDNTKYYLHYMNYGAKEKRNAASTTIFKGIDYKAVFDAKYYADNNPDLKKIYGYDEMKLFNHFTSCGMKEGRQASANFNVRIYRNRYKDLQRHFGSDFFLYYKHYVLTGKAEGRSGK